MILKKILQLPLLLLLTSALFSDERSISWVSGHYRVTWEYDHLGRIIKQEEDEKKTTLFAYDAKGRLTQKVAPSKTALDLSYDDFDRIVEIKSSDRSIHYQYRYADRSVQIFDLLQGIALEQIYDASGNLLRESNERFTLQWTYDDMGRRSSFILPDGSSIEYDLTSIRRVSAKPYKVRYFIPPSIENTKEMIFNLGILKTSCDPFDRPVLQTSPWHTLAVSYGPTQLVEKVNNSLFGEKEYSYDELDQLVRDGDAEYAFDSLGNPDHWQIGNYNQISETSDCRLIYDADGNLSAKVFKDKTIYYRYDALGRLIEIEKNGKKICYVYDPLSRLQSKETDGKKTFYLYDHLQEIGSLDENGNLLELKVGEIAIEIEGEVFAPIHDFLGSIIALIREDGSIAETYDLDAFGKKALSSALCPWRFCSKRTEEDLIFFGRRFYDPSLMRWLTPDPAGFIDGANLYAFVRNNPMNRYDLFGLLSLPFRIELPIAAISEFPDAMHCQGKINDSSVDWIVACGFLDQLKLTFEEIDSGIVNLAEHLSDLIPKDGRIFGILTYQNGIKTTLSEFTNSCRSIAEKVPEGTLLIGLHNKTKGITRDVHRLIKEILCVDTSIVKKTRQFLGSLGVALHDINPELLWGHILHSEGGAISRRAIEGLSPEHQNYLKQHLYVYALGPMLPIPLDYAYHVVNIYSREDFIGIGSYLFGIGGYTLAARFFGTQNCNIQFIPCTSKWYEKFLFLVDHAVLHGTYGSALDDQIKRWREGYRFYDGSQNP